MKINRSVYPRWRVRNSQARKSRRGVAVIIVLTIIAITMSMSYAILRSQSTIVRIQSNSNLRGNARQAAMTGYLVALRKIQDASWAGADTTFTGNAAANMTYSVSYVTGDASLTSTSSDYSEYPYRITMTVTGTATDPTNSAASVTDHIQAVLKLVPRALQAEPTNFSSITQYTVYQTDTQHFQIENRRRIEGPVLVKGDIRLFTEAPNGNSPNTRYIQDLGLLRMTSGQDYRPFNAQINLPFNSTNSTIRGQLTTNFGLTLVDTSATSMANDWSFPSSVATYKLYTGGKSYTVATAAATLSNTTLTSNPLTNPAGIFYRNGDVSIGNGVTILGTLMSSGKIQLTGTSLNLQPVSLPALRGTTTRINLPVLVASDDLRLQGTATGTVTGFIGTFSEFILDQRSQATSLQLFGHVATPKFTWHDCIEWNSGSSWWSTMWILFTFQAGQPGGQTNFVTWLASGTLPSTPTVTLKPETSVPVYHWQNGSNPIFVKHTSDPGLRWDVLNWKENP